VVPALARPPTCGVRRGAGPGPSQRASGIGGMHAGSGRSTAGRLRGGRRLVCWAGRLSPRVVRDWGTTRACSEGGGTNPVTGPAAPGTLDALRAMPAVAAEHLSQLLDDSDPDVRLLACEIARALPTGDASRVLGELIEKETNSNVCSAAIEILAETGDVASLPILARCAARFPNDPFLTFAVKTASGRIGSSER